MKIIEKIGPVLADDDGPVIFSFEYCTPKPSHAGPEAVLDTIARMAAYGPAFSDVTWRPQPPYPENTLSLAGRMQSFPGVETNLHLTSLSMPLASIDHALATARAAGIRNVLALRGDPIEPPIAEDAFTSAIDLVRYIRATHGDYFGISVAGYPEAHPSKIPEGSDRATEEGYESDLAYLKEKVEAGADLVITQLFFDASIFLKFLDDCRRIGIKCPIVPGIMPITTYRNFKFMTETCKTRVPAEVRERVEALKGDNEALGEYGVELATAICKELVENGVRMLHFYTMNKEGPSVKVLRNLGVIAGEDAWKVTIPRQLKVREPLENGVVVAA
ncbi:methylenetetrahydrofolate reductase (NADPH) protein [Dioscorea alata]|uniref:Methylenetetrahydrofolate reductase (NADPH) protein n=1 Tax=Dioscorea alata TaxID=55571 RepID=A0ACB7WDX8_DIOAL|nr:methylenetetrahydrofolate reductase (NADPH) protein [Dioscorea alata]